MNKPVFVLGNGTSRLGLDLEKLQAYGKIYGCNALYRDFTPDVLVAVDPMIIKEIEDSGYPERHVFHAKYPKHPASRPLVAKYGVSSGSTAIAHAVLEPIDTVYLIGFDLVGLGGRHNNVYSDTPCYAASDSIEVFYGNWVNQTEKILKAYTNIDFVKVGDNQYVPPSWQLDNFHNMSKQHFVEKFDSITWNSQKESD